MTARRTITVDGKDYKYVIGLTTIKIDGVGAWQRTAYDLRNQPVTPRNIRMLIQTGECKFLDLNKV